MKFTFLVFAHCLSNQCWWKITKTSSTQRSSDVSETFSGYSHLSTRASISARASLRHSQLMTNLITSLHGVLFLKFRQKPTEASRSPRSDQKYWNCASKAWSVVGI